jgi:hypothetical protein
MTRPYADAQRDAIYLAIVQTRLALKETTAEENKDTVDFLDRAVTEVQAPEALAELALDRLVLLNRAFQSIPLDRRDKPAEAQWLKKHEQEAVYSEPAGQSMVTLKAFWDLAEKYKALPIAERIVWEGAQAPVAGECEGYMPCVLDRMDITLGRYLASYPRGPHIAQVTGLMAEELEGFLGDDLKVSPEERLKGDDAKQAKALITKLRTEMDKVSDPAKNRVLSDLDKVAGKFLGK